MRLLPRNKDLQMRKLPKRPKLLRKLKQPKRPKLLRKIKQPKRLRPLKNLNLLKSSQMRKRRRHQLTEKKVMLISSLLYLQKTPWQQ